MSMRKRCKRQHRRDEAGAITRDHHHRCESADDLPIDHTRANLRQRGSGAREDDARERRADRDECGAVTGASMVAEHAGVIEQQDERGRDDHAAADAQQSAKKACNSADQQANNGEKQAVQVE